MAAQRSPGQIAYEAWVDTPHGYTAWSNRSAADRAVWESVANAVLESVDYCGNKRVVVSPEKASVEPVAPRGEKGALEFLTDMMNRDNIEVGHRIRVAELLLAHWRLP